MITRSQIREQFPQYDNALALDKIMLENSLDTRAGNLRKNIERPLELILTIGMPIGTYFLQKEGLIAPDPDFPGVVGRYVLAAGIGLLTGKALGTAIGTLVNEVVDQEGEINQFYQKVKNYLSKNTDSG